MAPQEPTVHGLLNTLHVSLQQKVAQSLVVTYPRRLWVVSYVTHGLR